MSQQQEVSLNFVLTSLSKQQKTKHKGDYYSNMPFYPELGGIPRLSPVVGDFNDISYNNFDSMADLPSYDSQLLTQRTYPPPTQPFFGRNSNFNIYDTQQQSLSAQGNDSVCNNMQNYTLMQNLTNASYALKAGKTMSFRIGFFVFVSFVFFFFVFLFCVFVFKQIMHKKNSRFAQTIESIVNNVSNC